MCPLVTTGLTVVDLRSGVVNLVKRSWLGGVKCPTEEATTDVLLNGCDVLVKVPSQFNIYVSAHSVALFSLSLFFSPNSQWEVVNVETGNSSKCWELVIVECSSLNGTSLLLLQRLKKQLRGGGQKECKRWKRSRVVWNTVFWAWNGYWTHELTAAVINSTRPVEEWVLQHSSTDWGKSHEILSLPEDL